MRQKVETFAKGLFSDLRDRRLLPVVAVLVVAILAVPFLIKGDDPAPTPVVDVEAAQLGAPEADPVVVADAPGLRDYRERLDRLRRKNPFEQQLTQPIGGAAPAEGDGSGSGIPTQGSTDGDIASAGSTSTGTTGTSVDGGEPVDADTPPDTPPTKPSKPPKGDPRVVTFSIDVKVGPMGEARVRRDVKSMTLLPNDENPVLQYLQASYDETDASFAVSRRVAGTDGEGRCSPDRSRCEFLLLEVGEAQNLVYEPNGRTYRIKLLAVNRHERRVKGSSGKGGDGPPATEFSAE